MNIGRMLMAAASVFFICTVQSFVQADQLDEIRSKGVIRIAVPQDHRPFGFVDSEMNIQGYDVDMAVYIARELGVRCKLIPVIGSQRISFLQSGRADIVIAALGKTEERQKAIDFSIAYCPTFSGVFGPALVPLPNPESLRGHSVGSARGSIEEQMLAKLVPSGVVFKRYEDNSTAAQAYISGQTEFICCLSFLAESVAKKIQKERVPVLKFRLRNSPNYIGLMKGEDRLRSAVNAAVVKAFHDGMLNRLCQAYLGMDIPGDMLQQEPGI